MGYQLPNNYMADMHNPQFGPNTTALPTGEETPSLKDLSGFVVPDFNNPGGVVQTLAARQIMDVLEVKLAMKFPRFANFLAKENPALWHRMIRGAWQFIGKDVLATGFGNAANTGLLDDALDRAGLSVIRLYSKDKEFIETYQKIRRLNPSIAAEAGQAVQSANASLNAATKWKPVMTQLQTDLASGDPSKVKAAKNYLSQLQQNKAILNNPDLATEVKTMAQKAGNAIVQTDDLLTKGVNPAVTSEIAQAAKIAQANPKETKILQNVFAKLSSKLPAIQKIGKSLPVIGLLLNIPGMIDWINKIQTQGVNYILVEDAYSRAKFISFLANALGSVGILIPPVAPIGIALGALGLGTELGAEAAHYAGDPDAGLNLLGWQAIPESQTRLDQNATINMSLNTPLYPEVQKALNQALALRQQGKKGIEILELLRPQYPWMKAKADAGNPQYTQFLMQYTAQKNKLPQPQRSMPQNFHRLTNAQDVMKWQQFLKSKGYTLSVDGLYGPETAQATRQYQHNKNIPVDGIFGPITLKTAYDDGFSL